MANEDAPKFRARKVATEEGARFYGKPIGSEITAGDQAAAEGRKRPVTMFRLRSLQRQFIKAKEGNNTPVMNAVQKQFKEEIKIYMETTGKTVRGIFDELDATPNEGFKESTEVNDTDTEDGNKPNQVNDPGTPAE